MKILSTPTMRRMPTYLHFLMRKQQAGEEWASCAELAHYMNIPHILVRKDVAMTGLPGHRRYGFKVNDLINAILRFVGWDNGLTATLIGAGSLGSALLGFSDFSLYHFRIDSVFDTSPAKIGNRIHGYEIYDLAYLEEKLKSSPPKVGILCVPASEAQKVADALIRLGVRYLWNFANTCLKVPEGVIVQREIIASGLAVLAAKIKKIESGDKTPETEI